MEKLYSDDDAYFDKVIELDVTNLEPQVTWELTQKWELVLVIHSQKLKMQMTNVLMTIWDFTQVKSRRYKIRLCFLGSCTNARLSDLIEASHIIKGQQVHPNITAIVVPGSRTVKKEAEALGLDKLFKDAGFEWREPGCSMCLGMNPDQVPEGVHCASTSNRNFEGRQGKGARTHLVSPAMAAAAAINGKFIDVRKVVV